MKNIKFLWLLASCFIFLECNAWADKTTEKESSSNYGEQFISARLNDLHEKIQLTAKQENAWNTWSKGVEKDFKDMHQMMWDEYPMNSKKHELMQTTPERLEAYQNFLNHRLDLLKQHIDRVNDSAKRTMALYSLLDSKQKVIFDLYWSNWQSNYMYQHPMMGAGGGQHRFMQPKFPPNN